jgi:hypothetical protein
MENPQQRSGNSFRPGDNRAIGAAPAHPHAAPLAA